MPKVLILSNDDGERIGTLIVNRDAVKDIKRQLEEARPYGLNIEEHVPDSLEDILEYLGDAT